MTFARHRSRLGALAAILLAASLIMVPTTPASADDEVTAGAVVLVGTAHLVPGLLASGDGCFAGVAVGAGAVPPTVAPGTRPVPNAWADFQYRNSQLEGDAQGHVLVEGSELPSLADQDLYAQFSWLRAGASALVFLEGENHWGVAVAAFAPAEPPLFACPSDREGKNGEDWDHPSGTDDHALVAAVGVLVGCSNDPLGQC